jgi:hypothetical protein
VHGADELDALRESWDRCALNNGSYFPFLCFDWFVTWFRHFPETKLHIAVLYENAEVAAIMPMMQQTRRRGGLSLSSYAFAGNAYSQARAILHNTTNPSDRVEQATLLLRSFMQHAPSWDYLDLYGLQTENGSCEQIMQAATGCGLPCRKTTAYINCYQDNITLSAEEYMNGRPRKVRKNGPYYLRKMQREGDLQFRFITCAENLDAIMDSYYLLYARSWKRSEDLGPNFHRDLVRMVMNKGWLRLGFLDFNGVPIACQLWLVQDKTAFILKLFYDEHYKHYSPGTVLSERMLRTILEQDRVTGIDCLQGEEPYKFDWVDKRRAREHVVVYNATIRGRMLQFFKKLRHLLFNSNKRGLVRRICG